MSVSRIFLCAAATWLAGVGCARYEAPCTIGEPEIVAILSVPDAASLQLGRMSDDRVLVIQTEARLEPQADETSPRTQSMTVDALVLDRSGVRSVRHQVFPGLPYRETVNAYGPAWSQHDAWVGDALVMLSTQDTESVDGQGVRHHEQRIHASIHDERGLRVGPLSLAGAACTDCVLAAAVRAAGDEALIVIEQRAGFTTRGQMSWAALGANGEVRATGALGELAADERLDMYRFTRSMRDDAILIPIWQGPIWLTDNRFQRLIASFIAESPGEFDWDVGRARISRAWKVDSGADYRSSVPDPPRGSLDILTTQVGFDGRVLVAEDRLSRGDSILATADAPGAVGMLLWRDEQAWFAARGSDGEKLGGDVPIGDRVQGGELVPMGDRSFHFYDVVRQDQNLYRVQRQAVECLP